MTFSSLKRAECFSGFNIVLGTNYCLSSRTKLFMSQKYCPLSTLYYHNQENGVTLPNALHVTSFQIFRTKYLYKS